MDRVSHRVHKVVSDKKVKIQKLKHDIHLSYYFKSLFVVNFRVFNLTFETYDKLFGMSLDFFHVSSLVQDIHFQ